MNRLACLVVAAPLWAAVSIGQAATRAGYDVTRHPLNALSNGDLGWLQITNLAARNQQPAQPVIVRRESSNRNISKES